MNALHLPGYRILDFKQNKYDYLYVIEPEEPPYVCIHCGKNMHKKRRVYVTPDESLTGETMYLKKYMK